MRLPNAERAIVELRKVRDYLLSPGHPVGRFKALFFGRLGFTTETWQELRDELRSVPLQEEAELAERTAYGQKYIVRGTIAGAAGREARVLTVWIILNDEDTPRLVTAYPER